MMLKTVSLMDATLGVSSETGSKLFKIFRSIGNQSDRQTSASIGFAKSLALAGKVAPAKVMQDIADSSETIYSYMRNNKNDAPRSKQRGIWDGASRSSFANTSSPRLRRTGATADAAPFIPTSKMQGIQAKRNQQGYILVLSLALYR